MDKTRCVVLRYTLAGLSVPAFAKHVRLLALRPHRGELLLQDLYLGRSALRTLWRCGLSLFTRCFFVGLYEHWLRSDAHTMPSRHLAALNSLDTLMQMLQLHTKDHGAVTADTKKDGSGYRSGQGRTVVSSSMVQDAAGSLRVCTIEQARAG